MWTQLALEVLIIKIDVTRTTSAKNPAPTDDFVQDVMLICPSNFHFFIKEDVILIN